MTCLAESALDLCTLDSIVEGVHVLRVGADGVQQRVQEPQRRLVSLGSQVIQQAHDAGEGRSGAGSTTDTLRVNRTHDLRMTRPNGIAKQERFVQAFQSRTG